jgi:DNA polymerase V
MVDAGIFEGDYCVVDREEEIEHGNIVAAFLNGGFTVKYIDLSTRDQGFIRLVPANKNFKPFIVDASDEFTVWGKVTFTIRDWRKNHCLP